jgi:mono/diheme cytochrome c family protein
MKMTFRTIIFGGLIVFFAVVSVAVFLPALIWKPAQTTVAHPYTELEARGRELFYSNGCNYCHTQYVRADDVGMGPVSDAGNYVFDHPLILGSERTGPDLSYIGRKRSEGWIIDHFKDPRGFSPNSLMPNFGFLSDEDLNAIAAYLFAMGDRVAQERMVLPPAVYAYMLNPIDNPQEAPPADGSPQGWDTWTAASLQEGKDIYTAYCLTCHGCAGNGLGSYGGTMLVTPANFKQNPYRTMADDQWFWHVSEGIPGTLMPVWKKSLTEDQRWKVIRYIQQIFARPIMRDPDEGDPPTPYDTMTNPLPKTVETLEIGKAIFTRECLVCHGDSGHGDGPYATGLQPSPPDFDDPTHYDASYGDADYFWRISEGLPWSAMPPWKLQYSEEDRWALVYYIKVNFTQTDPRPALVDTQEYPDIYLTQPMPESASFERGKQTFLQYCASCHGLSGQGDGWDGQYLDVKPANFSDPNLRGMSDGDYLARVTYGIQNSAMPTWGEWLPEDQRWDAILFIQQAFVEGRPTLQSLYSGETASTVLTLSQDNWTGEGHVIDITNGQAVHEQYCATCHGDAGQGDGAGVANLPSGAPAAFPTNLDSAYIFWRVFDGVPESIMPPFRWALEDKDIWDVGAYVSSLLGGGGQ